MAVEDAAIYGKVPRDTGNSEPINTEATLERKDVPTSSATEMVVTRSTITELRRQLELQAHPREHVQPPSTYMKLLWPRKKLILAEFRSYMVVWSIAQS